MSDTLTPQLKSTVSQYPDYTIVLTGHSAGAAVATVGTVVLRNAGYTVDLVSVESTQTCPDKS